MEHEWHFDESQFSTTLMIQKPEQGGLFQFTKPVRGTIGEKRESKIQVLTVILIRNYKPVAIFTMRQWTR